MSATMQLGPPPADGDVNRGPTLNAITWVFASFSICFFCLRIYTHHFISRNLGLQDALMAFGLLLILAESSLVSYALSVGLGRHQYYLSFQNLSDTLKWQAIAGPMGIMAPCVPRIVVTMLLIKILVPSKLAVAYLWTMNILLFGICVACSSIVFARCTPVSAQWTGVGKCWNPNILTDVSVAQGSFATFVDFALAVFPIPTIWKLHMRIEKKIGVCLLLGFGSFAAICAAVKTSKMTKLNDHSDVTWQLHTLIMWVMLELNIVFICACIPVLRPLWRHHFGADSAIRSGGSSSVKWYKASNNDNNEFVLRARDNRLAKDRSEINDASSSVNSILRSTETSEDGIRVTRDVEITSWGLK